MCLYTYMYSHISIYIYIHTYCNTPISKQLLTVFNRKTTYIYIYIYP